MQPDTSVGFRWRGEFIPAAQFENSLFDHASLTWTICAYPANEVLGLVQILGVHAADRFAELVVAAFNGTQPTAVGEALLLAIDEAFRQRDLRKLYVHLTERSLACFASTVARFVTVEGVLREHLWMGGRHQDVTIGVINRQQFAEHLARSPLRHISHDDWYVLEDRAPHNRPTVDLDRFRLLLGDICGGQVDPSISASLIISDSLALVEVLAALNDIADREITVEAVLATATVADLLALAEAVCAQP